MHSQGAAPRIAEDGVPAWLGPLPSHWRLERAKWLFHRMERPPGEDDEVVTCFRDGVVTLRKNRRTRGFTESLEGAGYQGIRSGDLVIHGMDAFAGAIGVSDSDGKSTGVYVVCEPRVGVDAHYYKYVLREMARNGWILALAKGIRERSTDFRFATFGAQMMPVPPHNEQRLIATFLDDADRRIRRAIRAKQKLIVLLNEQKQAVIYQAVTRGLDPNVGLKPSGIPWLGDIPEHWDLTPNRALLRPRKEVAGADSSDLTLLSLTKRGIIARDVENPEGKFPASFDAYQRVLPGDLIFCLFDIDETPRAVGLSSLSGMITGAYTRFVPTDAAVTEFLYLFYLAMDDGKRLRPLYTGLRKVITKSAFLSARTPIPPAGERTAIVGHVNEESRRIDAVVDHTATEIRLLREYQVRLISDVVTGKFDVHEAAVDLPRDLDDPEPLDDLDQETDVEPIPDELEPVEA